MTRLTGLRPHASCFSRRFRFERVSNLTKILAEGRIAADNDVVLKVEQRLLPSVVELVTK
jgi:hypothetical protein